MYRTAIVLKKPILQAGKQTKMISMNGTRQEVESFIMENMDNMVKCRTMDKETKQLDSELTIIA